MARFIVGVSGASGIILAYRAIVRLASLGHFIELVITQQALYTATLELGKEFSTAKKILQGLPEEIQEQVTLHAVQDSGASICSGSYHTDGMLIVPCSMATLAAIACGLGDNCLRRAADVILKERRRLVIVPRESPLNQIHLENMLKLTSMGAMMVLPVPAWYTQPRTLEDVENFIVGKALDALGVADHNLYPRWD